MTGVEGHARAGCAHPGLQLSDTNQATVNVLDCWLPEINVVISSWTRGVRRRPCNSGKEGGHMCIVQDISCYIIDSFKFAKIIR